MIKYCIWDVGNTMYPFSLDPFDEWAKHKTKDIEFYTSVGGVKAYNYNEYMSGQCTNEEFVRDICRTYQISFEKKTMPEVNKALHRGVGKFFDETMQAIDLLEKSGVHNVLLSNALPMLGDTVDFILPKYSFPSYEIHALKPDIRAFEIVKNKLNCQYSEMMFFDDKQKNIDSALSLGIIATLYNKNTVIANAKNIISQYNISKSGYCKIY